VVHHNKFYYHFRWRYPLEVLSKYSWIHSLALDDELETKLKSRAGKPCIIHLAEGVDELARAELSRLIEMGGLTRNTVIVHGIGLSTSDIGLVEKAGASLIWCPSSNDFLFHSTAPVEQAFKKIRIALGTDSTLSGNASMFDEIRHAARSRNIDPMSILKMVTSMPADIFGIDKGVIAEGKPADLLLYDCEHGDPLDGFLGLDISKIKCLIKKGVPLYGDPSVVKSFQVSAGRYTHMEASRTKKMIRGDLKRLMTRISQHLPSFDFNGLPISLGQSA
jgi:imidazolonepropionase-like amidohydrolase